MFCLFFLSFCFAVMVASLYFLDVFGFEHCSGWYQWTTYVGNTETGWN
jgi:hypothetical protein